MTLNDNSTLVRIVIAGDTCPIGRNEKPFMQGDVETLLNDLLPEFEKTDLSIVNLECPLIQESSPIEKIGPNIGASIDCINGLKAMNIDVVGLANNHIMDHGPQGLRSTIKALDEHGIAHVGANENIGNARKILVKEINGIRIGILAVTEHEFSIADNNSPGANPLNVIDFVRNVSEVHFEYDELIVLLHGGNENYLYPRPGLMETCHFLVEQGASAVICQHSHCVGCMETYMGAPIVYGQGNFLFDLNSKYPEWHIGCLVQLTFDQERSCSTHLIPFYQAFSGDGARHMTKKEEANWRLQFDERSRHLDNPQIIEEKWQTFCEKHKRLYLHKLHGNPSLFRRLLGKLNLLHLLDNKKIQRGRLNIIRCESHHEALKTILQLETLIENDNTRRESRDD